MRSQAPVTLRRLRFTRYAAFSTFFFAAQRFFIASPIRLRLSADIGRRRRSRLAALLLNLPTVLWRAAIAWLIRSRSDSSSAMIAFTSILLLSQWD
jgi:hypothetical protein